MPVTRGFQSSPALSSPRSSRRGRTRPERLHLLDAWLKARLPALLPPGPLRWADVGYGDTPETTLRTHRALLAAGYTPETVGVERDAGRVRRARERHSLRSVGFLQSGFDVRHAGLSQLQLVRAMNVLRAYPLEQAARAQRSLSEALGDGGWLLEGTTDTEGHVCGVHAWQRRGRRMAYAGLLLGSDGARGFAPRLLRDFLPRDLRRHVRPPEPIHALLSDWQQHWEAGRQRQDRDHGFARSLSLLQGCRGDVSCELRLETGGVARWHPERRTARPEVFDGWLDSSSAPHARSGAWPGLRREAMQREPPMWSQAAKPPRS